MSTRNTAAGATAAFAPNNNNNNSALPPSAALMLEPDDDAPTSAVAPPSLPTMAELVAQSNALINSEEYKQYRAPMIRNDRIRRRHNLKMVLSVVGVLMLIGGVIVLLWFTFS